MTTALEVRGITVRFGGITALDDVDLRVGSDEILGLIGPNGAGKTTLLDAISGFVTPVRGSLRLGDQDLSGLLPYQRARLGLGRSFQDARLWPTMTVRETLRCGFHAEFRTSLLDEGLSIRRARQEDARVAARADELLRLVDLDHYLDHLVSELSFGTTRAVELAWLAARQPRVLLLDEPAAGLQQSEVGVLGGLIQAIRGDAAVVVIDHDVPFVAGVADRMAALDLGRMLVVGTADEVLSDPGVIASYLGTGAYSGTGA